MTVNSYIRRFGIAVIIAAYAIHTGNAFLHELSGEIRPDATIYFAVGRGILNGLTPYVDLFDFRPPGMFLVGALSLLLSKGYSAAHWMEAVIVLIIPLIVLFAAPKKKLWSLAFGCILMLLIMADAGNIQTESFGAVFALLCIGALYRSQRHAYLIAGLGLSGAVLLKEPFVFSILGAALVIKPRPLLIIRTGIVALVVWLIVMMLTGTLFPYFSFYLPYTAALRASEFLLLEGFKIWNVIAHYWQFSPVFLVLITLLIWFYAKMDWKKWLMVIAALYLMTIAVGATGDFYAQHQVFAIPVLLAFFVRSTLHTWTKAFLIAAPFTIALSPIHATHAWEVEKREATTIDRIMDGCEYERYLFIGGLGSSIPALTTHSPLGPGFFISDYTARTIPLVKSMQANIQDTNLIVFQKTTHVLGSEKKVYDVLQQEAIEHFTVAPPSCVKENMKSDQYVLFFRKTQLTATL